MSDMELVEFLHRAADEHQSSMFKVVAGRITALSAEVERLSRQVERLPVLQDEVAWVIKRLRSDTQEMYEGEIWTDPPTDEALATAALIERLSRQVERLPVTDEASTVGDT